MIIPKKIAKGSHVRVIAPSCTLPTIEWMPTGFLDVATEYFLQKGMRVSEGKYLREMDTMGTTSIEHRLDDLHAAFADANVNAIFCIRGGWQANQLLRGIDFDLIAKNPKIFCGFSDITVLQNAIWAKTGLVTYSGPNFTHFAYGVPDTIKSFEACLLHTAPYELAASTQWRNGSNADWQANSGHWILREGKAEGTILGGNLCTINLLQGTEWMPDLHECILLVEDDHESDYKSFDRNLQSLLHLPGTETIRALVIGRFQEESHVTREILEYIIATKPELGNIPIIANVDFGHTHPMGTFPIGGEAEVIAKGSNTQIHILERIPGEVEVLFDSSRDNGGKGIEFHEMITILEKIVDE